MAQTLNIKLNNLGGNTGPFNLYAVDAAGVETLVQSNVPKSQLLAGIQLTNIPNNAVKIKVLSTSALCNSYNYINIPYPTTTTTTLFPPTTTTTTSNLVISNCSAIYVANLPDPALAKVYAYDPITNIASPLVVPGITGFINTTVYSDIAHTASKLWFTDGANRRFIEYNITLNTWTAAFSQYVLFPQNFTSSSGLHAINNFTLLTVDEGIPGFSKVSELNITTGVVTPKFDLQSGRKVSGDFLLTVNNKFIVINYDVNFNQYISQYDYLTGTLEFDLAIPSLVGPLGIFESGGFIYITTFTNGLFKMSPTAPYTIISVGYPIGANPADRIRGASQIASCLTASYTSNTTTTSSSTTSTTSTTSTSTSTTTTTTTPPCGCYKITNNESNPSVTYQLVYADCSSAQQSTTILCGNSFSWCGTGIFFPTVVQTGASWNYSLISYGTCGVNCPPTTTTSTSTTSTTSTTTSTTSTTTSSTTTTTTAPPCNCITFNNISSNIQEGWYKDCNGTYVGIVIPANAIVRYCGCCGGTSNPSVVFITTGSACVAGACQTTTTTTALPETCQEVVFYNPSLTVSGVVTYIDCYGVSQIQNLAPLQSSFNTCLLPSTIFISNPQITTTVVSGTCNITTTTSTTTTPPTTTTTTNAYSACAINWAPTNLSVTTYANGDPIPEVSDPNQWNSLTTGAWCYYQNNPANEPIYGRLYNWYALTDPRGLALPTGYRLSTSSDWATLKSCVGNQAARLKSTTGWSAGSAPVGTNDTGFTALPGGLRAGTAFSGIGGVGYWWNADSISGNFISVNASSVNSPGGVTAGAGMSVRLIKI